MTFAFSRDGAIPGSAMLSKVDCSPGAGQRGRCSSAVIGAIITLPGADQGRHQRRTGAIAFYAVVSVAVIGLYLAFLIPIYLRWKLGDAFEAGSWTNGKKYKWMNLVAVIEIAIICIYFILPLHPGRDPVATRSSPGSSSTTRRS